MLQAMRNKMHGWPSIIVLGLATAAMALFGMGDYLMGGGDGTNVAVVGKQKIDQRAYQDRVNQLRQQISEQQGDSFDSAEFEKMETKRRILDGMIDEQLLLQANADWGMRVSNAAVRDYIAAIPAFQVNGEFDLTSYKAYLAGVRKTPAQFEDEIRGSLATQIVPAAIAASTIVSESQVSDYLALSMQTRDLRYAPLPRPDMSGEQVSDAEIEAWYKAHVDQYMNPEQVSVKYLEVIGAELPLAAEPSDEELRARYEQEKQRFVKPEQRLASHILIDVPANATPDQQKAALAKAEKIAAEATPENFAELAKKDSQDLGSRRLGGDLGWLEKGVTNAAFDTALFALAKDGISKPVLSSDGYHVIWLRDVRSGESRPFEEVRGDLLKEATATERDRTYNEFAGKMSDETYQNPTSLEPAAVALKLPIKSTGLFPREGGEGIAANPKVVKAAFSDDVMVQGDNSPLIDLGNNHSVVLHIDQHVAAAAKPLAEVREDVRGRIIAERVAAIEKKQADEALARLAKGETLDAVAASLGTTVSASAAVGRHDLGLPAPLVEQAFLLPHPAEGKAEYAAVDMHDSNYILLAVDKVADGDVSKLPDMQRAALRSQMGQAYSYEATQELLKALRAKTKIEINDKLL